MSGAKISRASTTITFIVIVLAGDILAPFGNLPENNREFYEFMIYRNVNSMVIRDKRKL